MSVTAKQLADGQLPNSDGALYTAPGSTTTYVTSMILHNTSAAAVTCTLRMKPSGGTARVIGYVSLGAHETYLHNERLVLDTGDAIRGVAGTAAVIDYSIYGAEEM